MELNEYQEKTATTAIYPGSDPINHGSKEGLAYASLGLAGESGEVGEIAFAMLGLGLTKHSGRVAELVKKFLRGDDGYAETLDDNECAARRDKLLKELGDVLWYLAQMATQAGFELEFVAVMNLDKLNKRYGEGHIIGDGSDR